MKRGEVWLASLEPQVGAEIGKRRPVAVVSRDDVGVLPLRIVVPITSWQDRFEGVPWLVKLIPSGTNGIRHASAADTFQVKSISTERIRNRLGVLSEAELDEITKTLTRIIGSDDEV